jgi:hypothetical protein
MEEDGREKQRKVERRIPLISGEETSTPAREISDNDHAKNLI